MTEVVVVLFEEIQIEDDHRDRSAGPSEARPLLQQTFVVGAAIGDTREPVGRRQRRELLVCLVQQVVQLPHLLLLQNNRGAREEHSNRLNVGGSPATRVPSFSLLPRSKGPAWVECTELRTWFHGFVGVARPFDLFNLLCSVPHEDCWLVDLQDYRQQATRI